MNWKTLAVIVLALLVSSIITFSALKRSDLALEKQVQAEALNAELKAEFVENIRQAKLDTAEPCGLQAYHPVRLVKPPEGLNESAVLIVGGQDVSNVSNWLTFQAQEPAPGEHAVRVAITPDAPEYEELIWLAPESKACKDGFVKDIKRFAVSNGRSAIGRRPAWPTSQEKEDEEK